MKSNRSDSKLTFIFGSNFFDPDMSDKDIPNYYLSDLIVCSDMLNQMKHGYEIYITSTGTRTMLTNYYDNEQFISSWSNRTITLCKPGSRIYYTVARCLERVLLSMYRQLKRDAHK